MKTINHLLCTLISVCISTISNAHDAWVMPSKGPVYNIFYGHKEPETYRMEKVTSIAVWDKNQNAIPYYKMEGEENMSIRLKQNTPALFALSFDNGYWVTIGDEHINKRISDMPEGTKPSHPLKYSKTIMDWQNWMAKPVGQRIEFIPVEASDKAPKAGSKLKLQLLLDGQPLAGQRVENNSNEKGPKTDANGMVTVTILKGINRFATDYDLMQEIDPDAKRLSLTAALVFFID